MREDEQEEAKLWERVASPDGDTKVDALLQPVSYTHLTLPTNREV